MTKRYVPDTNFFLQFKMASELPWTELTDSDHVQLVLVDGVVGELDKHKASGNERRSRRSRDYLHLLSPLFEDQEGQVEVVVRESGPKVSFVFAPYRPDAGLGPLSGAHPDELIVNQAFGAHSDASPVEMLTADRMMTVHAKRAGLKSKLLREEWRLPPEPSQADRELHKLRRQLAEAQAIAPDLSVTIVGWSAPAPYQAESVWRTPLPDGVVETTVERVNDFYPDDRSVPGEIIAYSKFAGGAYHEARGRWLGEVENQIRRLPALLNANRAKTTMIIEIANSGGSAAEGLVVEIEGCGDIAVVDSASHASLAERAIPCASISRPPRLSDFEPSMGSFGRMSDRIEPLRIPPIPVSRHPREFYWTGKGGDGGSKLTGQCAEFRHHIHVERHEFSVLVLPKTEPRDTVKGAVRIRLSAKNMARTVDVTVPVVIELHRRNAFDELAAVLRKRLVQ
ncbi:PIN domain-containing protein [Stenotrophomonas maltophilia]|uniref:PIN domain-containing protein n=1 Tax=Stenotrophomonas maltophilia TaxID=40324 RepID=UPI001310D601|nr:PIN domain-containing protein [Stenotrophomonas maltophilia]